MLYEVIEKYWKDVFDMPIWEWLEISRSSWSRQKNKEFPKKYMDKIKEHLYGHKNATDNEVICKLVIDYYMTK